MFHMSIKCNQQFKGCPFPRSWWPCSCCNIAIVWITIPQGPQYQTFGWLAHDLEGKDRTLKKRGIMQGRPCCEGALERQAGTLLVLLCFWLQGGEQALTWSFWSHTLKLLAIPYHWRLIPGSYTWWARNLWDTFSFVIHHSFIHSFWAEFH